MTSVCVNYENASKRQDSNRFTTVIRDEPYDSRHRGCHLNGSVESYSCRIVVRDSLLNCSKVSILSRGNQLIISSSFSLASLETNSATAATIDLITIVRDPDFHANVFNIQVNSIACCRKFFTRMVTKTKSNLAYIAFRIHSSSIGSIFMGVGEAFRQR